MSMAASPLRPFTSSRRGGRCWHRSHPLRKQLEQTGFVWVSWRPEGRDGHYRRCHSRTICPRFRGHQSVRRQRRLVGAEIGHPQAREQQRKGCGSRASTGRKSPHGGQATTRAPNQQVADQHRRRVVITTPRSVCGSAPAPKAEPARPRARLLLPPPERQNLEDAREETISYLPQLGLVLLLVAELLY